jgi:hypothetical protein
MTIAADSKRLGAKVGMTSVLHTWGSALTHHPHIHMIVPGGGLSVDGTKWVSCKSGFFLHVRILARLFRRLFLEGLLELHRAGQLTFFGELACLAQADAFTKWLAPFRKTEWVVYAKPPFGGPEAVLAYLSRYTHRIAISNHRLVSADANTVAFRWKDYRIKNGDRQKIMRLATPEFIRRSSCMSSPTGSTASATTACWQVQRAKRTSRRSGLCLALNAQKKPPSQIWRSRQPLLPCANHAHAAAALCASSKSSGAVRYLCHVRHQGSRQHDPMLKSNLRYAPVATG